MMYHSVPRLIQKLFPQRIWKLPLNGNTIFLTFDDGPVPGVTDFVLDELEKRSQQATFFMVGENVRKHPQLAVKVLTAGHQIGNHTQHHLNGLKARTKDYLNDVLYCDQTLKDILGIEVKYFRPPYGLMTPSQAQIISQEKKVVMWSLLTRDYEKAVDHSQILLNSKKLTQTGKIVVFHDQEKTKIGIRKMLPDYLDFLIDQGFQTGLL